MMTVLLICLVTFLGGWVLLAKSATADALKSRRDMADAISADDGTVLELLTKYDGEISRYAPYDGTPIWYAKIGVFGVRDQSLAKAWAQCVKYIRAQEAVEVEEQTP